MIERRIQNSAPTVGYIGWIIDGTCSAGIVHTIWEPVDDGNKIIHLLEELYNNTNDIANFKTWLQSKEPITVTLDSSPEEIEKCLTYFRTEYMDFNFINLKQFFSYYRTLNYEMLIKSFYVPTNNLETNSKTISWGYVMDFDEETLKIYSGSWFDTETNKWLPTKLETSIKFEDLKSTTVAVDYYHNLIVVQH